MVFNVSEHVQGVQYLLRFWRSDGVLNLNTHFYSVVFDLCCIFRENTHEQQLIQAKILYQCPSRNILDFVYGGSHFSTGVIFLRVRHVKNRPLWHFFYTWDTFFYGQGSFLYDEKWPLGRFSTGVVIRRYTGRPSVRLSINNILFLYLLRNYIPQRPIYGHILLAPWSSCACAILVQSGPPGAPQGDFVKKKS